jgi:uncharacterized protein VirK/YbjX
MPVSVFATAVKGWHFASVSYADAKPSSKLKQQFKGFFFALLNAKSAAEWFGIIESPDFHEVMLHRPELYLKPFRVYISVNWSTSQKIKVIKDTYRFITSKGQVFLPVIKADKGMEIARFKMNDTMEGYLTLGYDARYRKEGELTLSFFCDELGGNIVALAFSVEETEKDRWVCKIGCIQGHEKNESYSSKAAQKQLHGLRPKALVTFTIQELSRYLGLSNIYAVGDEIQAYRGKHAIHIHSKHCIKFDYDEFWQECGGQSEKEGWFELPLIPVRRGIEDIKSHKRAVYRRRYAMLDELSLKIADFVKKIEG